MQLKYILLLLLLPFLSKSQNIGIGASAIYNFQNESFGNGLRVSIMPNKTLSIVPQFSYFYGFNKVSEYYAGLALEYKFIKTDQLFVYAIAHGAYNSWLNYKSSYMEGAQANNWNLEGGIGISTTTRLRPFIEYRYNLKFRETHLDIGVLYIFKKKRSRAKHGKLCPAYDT